MAVELLGDEAGIQAILTVPGGVQQDLGGHLDAGNRRLNQLVGDTSYALLLAEDAVTITAQQTDAAHRAANLLGASSYMEDRALVMGERGAVVSTQKGEDNRESYQGTEQVLKAAVAYRQRAIRDLRLVGLYVAPSSPTPKTVDLTA